MNKRVLKNYICLIYPIFAVVYLLGIFFGGISTGMVITFFLLAGAGAVCALGLLTASFTEDKVFGLYLLYNVLSGIWCVAFGIPVSVYVGELSVTALPMMLYYAGRGFGEEYASKYYRCFMLSALFLAAAAALLYFFLPQLYPVFLYNIFGENLSSLQVGFGERSESWIAAVNNMVNFWIGDGLGSHGHRSAGYQDYIVADGGLVKLYSEMGLIGTSMIIFVLALVYIKAFRGRQATEQKETASAGMKTAEAAAFRGMKAAETEASKKKLTSVLPELLVITSAVLVSAGFNLLETVLFTPLIFFALGRAVRKLNDDRAGEEYTGPFEDGRTPEAEDGDGGLEGAPAAWIYTDDRIKDGVKA
ncbi:MAG: hypothetical protein IJT24_05620 [Lachnospiraceae bacterium]|nr:hypothetical protein [Lachnospiraceae bacterium]